MQRGWCGLMAAVCLTVPPVAATAREGKSAQELWAQCQAVNSPFHQGVCLGYLGAALDAALDAAAPAGAEMQEGPAVCLPEDYPTGRVREDFLVFMEANREARDLPAGRAVRTMLVSVHPCQAP